MITVNLPLHEMEPRYAEPYQRIDPDITDRLKRIEEKLDRVLAIADTLPTGPGRETGPVREQG